MIKVDFACVTVHNCFIKNPPLKSSLISDQYRFTIHYLLIFTIMNNYYCTYHNEHLKTRLILFASGLRMVLSYLIKTFFCYLPNWYDFYCCLYFPYDAHGQTFIDKCLMDHWVNARYPRLHILCFQMFNLKFIEVIILIVCGSQKGPLFLTICLLLSIILYIINLQWIMKIISKKLRLINIFYWNLILYFAFILM